MNNHSPYTTCLSGPTEGVVRQELISYEIRNGMLRKVSVLREFAGNDYTDSQIIETLCAVKEQHNELG